MESFLPKRKSILKKNNKEPESTLAPIDKHTGSLKMFLFGKSEDFENVKTGTLPKGTIKYIPNVNRFWKKQELNSIY
jgi:hypothetical protein